MKKYKTYHRINTQTWQIDPVSAAPSVTPGHIHLEHENETVPLVSMNTRYYETRQAAYEYALRETGNAVERFGLMHEAWSKMHEYVKAQRGDVEAVGGLVIPSRRKGFMPREDVPIIKHADMKTFERSAGVFSAGCHPFTDQRHDTLPEIVQHVWRVGDLALCRAVRSDLIDIIKVTDIVQTTDTLVGDVIYRNNKTECRGVWSMEYCTPLTSNATRENVKAGARAVVLRTGDEFHGRIADVKSNTHSIQDIFWLECDGVNITRALADIYILPDPMKT